MAEENRQVGDILGYDKQRMGGAYGSIWQNVSSLLSNLESLYAENNIAGADDNVLIEAALVIEEGRRTLGEITSSYWSIKKRQYREDVPATPDSLYVLKRLENFEKSIKPKIKQAVAKLKNITFVENPQPYSEEYTQYQLARVRLDRAHTMLEELSRDHSSEESLEHLVPAGFPEDVYNRAYDAQEAINKLLESRKSTELLTVIDNKIAEGNADCDVSGTFYEDILKVEEDATTAARNYLAVYKEIQDRIASKERGEVVYIPKTILNPEQTTEVEEVEETEEVEEQQEQTTELEPLKEPDTENEEQEEIKEEPLPAEVKTDAEKPSSSSKLKTEFDIIKALTKNPDDLSEEELEELTQGITERLLSIDSQKKKRDYEKEYHELVQVVFGEAMKVSGREGIMEAVAKARQDILGLLSEAEKIDDLTSEDIASLKEMVTTEFNNFANTMLQKAVELLQQAFDPFHIDTNPKGRTK